jgi:cyclopropane fatty-acyl-phospholipid synthase-like methyltransferase
VTIRGDGLDAAGAAERARLARVRAYWDETTPLYLEYLGTTLQGARYPIAFGADSARALNLYLARAAGIREGDRVLDAGCGVCGPSIDIARAIADVTVDAITLSPVQARQARQLIRAAGLADRVRVRSGDYHHLPFPAGVFDVAMFLESSSYSGALEQLFAGVLRTLRPGGTLYVKDIFRREGPLTEDEAAELARMCDIYEVRPTTPSLAAAAATAAGFENVTIRSLYDDLSFVPALATFFTEQHGRRVLNPFGQRHWQRFELLPTGCWEIKARAPGATPRQPAAPEPEP